MPELLLRVVVASLINWMAVLSIVQKEKHLLSVRHGRPFRFRGWRQLFVVAVLYGSLLGGFTFLADYGFPQIQNEVRIAGTAVMTVLAVGFSMTNIVGQRQLYQPLDDDYPGES